MRPASFVISSAASLPISPSASACAVDETSAAASPSRFTCRLAAPAVADIYQDPTNIAPLGTASQSSTDDWRAAYHANNGTVATWDAAQSSARTLSESNAWWHLDLGSVQSFTHVKVWRGDLANLANFSVFVSDVPFVSTDPVATRSQPGVSEYSLPGTAGPSERFTHAGTGRYIRVQLLGSGVLDLDHPGQRNDEPSSRRALPVGSGHGLRGRRDEPAHDLHRR